MRSLLVGGPFNGEWIEQTVEAQSIFLDEAGEKFEYERTLWLWRRRNALFLFYWYGNPKPSHEEVLAVIDAQKLEPICSYTDAFQKGDVDPTPSRHD